MPQMTGAEFLLRDLQRKGVKHIFGLPGGAVLPIYDALYDFQELEHILVRHEQGAAHAADGYARVSGKPGIVFATSGPGATNLVTGISTAYSDSSPIIAVTGQVPVSYIGKDVFQEADIFSLFLPITKYNFIVKDVKELPRAIRLAFDIALSGRPGPVHIDFPKDIQAAKAKLKHIDKVLYNHKKTLISVSKIRRIAEILVNSEKPVILAGGGVIISNASEELRVFAELLGAPVATTLMGKGAISEYHPLALGMVGMHGTKAANLAITESDCLIAIGTRFSDRSTGDVRYFAPNAKVIHIDVDPSEIGKNVKTNTSLVSDAKEALKALIYYLQASYRKFKSSEWGQRIKKLKEETKLPDAEPTYPIKPPFVIKTVAKLLNEDDIVVTEVGQCEMWAAMHYKVRRPRTFIASGGQGTMGFGLPASIGAQVARPESKVVDIAGDGSFLMVCQEMATAAEHEIPIVVIILDNRYLGMVRQWQELFYKKRYSHVFLGEKTDFVKIAEGFGAKGIKVERPSELKSALEEAFKSREPHVIDVVIDRECNVFPMVPAGQPIDKMIGER
ncbi:MAG: biosynthetic-type acetolactate synthase large subunit [Candidatus Odinarchaeia archaeon]